MVQKVEFDNLLTSIQVLSVSTSPMPTLGVAVGGDLALAIVMEVLGTTQMGEKCRTDGRGR